MAMPKVVARLAISGSLNADALCPPRPHALRCGRGAMTTQHDDSAAVLVVYHSYNGPVARLAAALSAAAEGHGVTTQLVPIAELNDQQLLQADGIAIGSPKCAGHTPSPEILQLLERMSAMRERLAAKVGTAFSGSHSSFGGQELVHQSIFHAMLAANMLVVGTPQPTDGYSDFVGGVIVDELDAATASWAAALGARLAIAALWLRRGSAII